jgi:hypothetical protein
VNIRNISMNLLVTMHVKHPVMNMTSSLDYLMIQKCVSTDYHELVNYCYIFSNIIRFKFIIPNAMNITRHSFISPY